ncbi:hypothetical protein PAP_03050 [Palaeococcus pacificus DY20341]|uniref:NTP pyrophosphohydrolase MazG-like domain-containing protein n=1 Tax=Palaeococcus pacificus DY20341 TaxID=1343739 RepID=A0A075LQM2_9EURY|nr:MazG nucleotide pyrophosphohydrolase domain-containing protein [Palaeococcus pacificus]AIF69030.1 hypothetical protein PAP_03050 [Palaeococcus pacificus DY20341]
MRKLQSEVDELVNELGGYWKPFEMLAALIEELGEFSKEMLKFEGIKGENSKEKLIEEFGDVLFALVCIANYYGIDCEEALRKSISKYANRDLNLWK